MFKNTAAKFIVFAFDSATGLPKSGDAANITAYVGKDYGAATVLADTSATEIDATNAKGYYLFDAAQAETNADCLHITGKSSTSGIVVVGAPAVIYTRPQTGWLAPTTTGRTLDVSAGGEAGVDWANVGSPTATNALTGTTIAVTQKVDVDSIKTDATSATNLKGYTNGTHFMPVDAYKPVFSVSGTTLTIKEPDGTTTAYTKTLTTNAAAVPVVGAS